MGIVYRMVALEAQCNICGARHELDYAKGDELPEGWGILEDDHDDYWPLSGIIYCSEICHQQLKEKSSATTK